MKYPTQQQLVDSKYLPTYLSKNREDRTPDDQTLRIWMSKNPDKGRELMRHDRREGYGAFVYEARTKRKAFDLPYNDNTIATWETLQALRLPALTASIARLLIEGYSRNEIAQTLGIHRTTVWRHMQVIKDRLSGNMPVLHCSLCSYKAHSDLDLADHVRDCHYGASDCQSGRQKGPRGKEMRPGV